MANVEQISFPYLYSIQYIAKEPNLRFVFNIKRLSFYVRATLDNNPDMAPEFIPYEKKVPFLFFTKQYFLFIVL